MAVRAVNQEIRRWLLIMNIRAATNLDRDDIHSIHLSAFEEDERDLVAKLAVDLLSEETTPETISLVAEIDGVLVGHVAFSPVSIDGDENLKCYILAPLGIKPDYQKRGIGSKLIETGMQQLSTMDVNILIVYGDPEYYGRFGFTAEAAERYIPPYELQYPFGWLAIVFNECATDSSPVNTSCVRSLCNPVLW